MNKYGPNSAQVEALLEKIKTITPEQAETLAIIWERSNNCADEWDEVWMRAIHASEGRRGEWEAAFHGASHGASSALACSGVIVLIFSNSASTCALFGPYLFISCLHH